ncbi:MAG: diguanylate cyclase [Burkholderiales bacterium]
MAPLLQAADSAPCRAGDGTRGGVPSKSFVDATGQAPLTPAPVQSPETAQPPKPGLAQQLRQTRLQLLNRMYIAAAGMALFYLPALWWAVADTGWNWLLALNGFFSGVGLVLFTLRRRIPVAWASVAITGSVAGIGLAGMAALGMVGAGYWWMLQAATFTATLYSLRAGVAIAAVSALVMTAIGVGFVSGHLGAGFDANEYVRSGSAWAGFLVAMVFAPTAVLLIFSGYQHTIKKLAGELDAQREALAALVGRDTLTGLPQATLAADRLQVAMHHAARTGRKVALLFVDLDAFKAVNDTHGHAAGDHVLRHVARQIRASVREQDTVARVGGDEFVVILVDVQDQAAACTVAAKILASSTGAVAWEGKRLNFGASIGIALYPDHAQDAGALRHCADVAMYEAKKGGRNRWRLAVAAPGGASAAPLAG